MLSESLQKRAAVMLEIVIERPTCGALERSIAALREYTTDVLAGKERKGLHAEVTDMVGSAKYLIKQGADTVDVGALVHQELTKARVIAEGEDRAYIDRLISNIEKAIT